MNCQNREQELANVQEVTEAAAPETEVKPAACASGKPSVPYIIAFASICLMALGYVLMWVSNAFLRGAGVANAGFITSTLVGSLLALCIRLFLHPPSPLSSTYTRCTATARLS